MRHLLATILLGLVSACAPMPALAQNAALTARLHDLNAWVRLHTAYKAKHLPRVVTRSQEDMARTYYGEHYNPSLATFIKAMAMQGVIFLPPGIRLDGSDDWVLVHELVHFQQWEAGRGEECSGHREAEAYALQDKFVESTGRGEKSDPMTVLAHVAACHGY